MENCIFCTLYKNKSNVIYETEHVFVLVDRNPLASGHLLVIPKVHRAYLHLHNSEELSDALRAVKYVVERFGFKEYNVLQNNGNHQSVPHVHFHVVPCISEYERLRIDWKTIILSNDEYAKRVDEAKERLSN